MVVAVVPEGVIRFCESLGKPKFEARIFWASGSPAPRVRFVLVEVCPGPGNPRAKAVSSSKPLGAEPALQLPPRGESCSTVFICLRVTCAGKEPGTVMMTWLMRARSSGPATPCFPLRIRACV